MIYVLQELHQHQWEVFGPMALLIRGSVTPLLAG